MRWAARTTHALFYALLLIMPLSGWWMSSAVPDRHSFGFGLFEVPFLPVPRGCASAGPAYFVHTNLAWLMLGLLVGAHGFLNEDAEALPAVIEFLTRSG